jgi:NAD(P)-dependent dehydrogenase (short-subunit alcohol dehydrogenase family)
MATLVSLVYAEVLRMKYPAELAFLQSARKPILSSKERLTNQIILLTGATSGIGKVTLARLLEDDVHVVVMGRSSEKLDQLTSLYGSKITPYKANFSVLSDVIAAAKRIQLQHPRIDTIIHCAGLHSTTKVMATDGYEQTLTVNHLAAYILTQELLGNLNPSSNPHVLFVNSEGHRFGAFDPNDPNFEKKRYTGLKGYGASKSAQLHVMHELTTRYPNIRFNALHPGAVKSNIGSNNGIVYRTFSKFLIQPFLKSPSFSARAIHYLLAEPSMQDVRDTFFYFTTPETPAPHALMSPISSQTYEFSMGVYQNVKTSSKG